MSIGNTKAAWWNGLISAALLFDIGWFLRYVYLHEWDGIVRTIFFGLLLFIAWLLSWSNE